MPISPYYKRNYQDTQDPRFSLGGVQTNPPYNLGVELPPDPTNESEIPQGLATLASAPAPQMPSTPPQQIMPKLEEITGDDIGSLPKPQLPTDVESEPNRRMLYRALSEFSAGMGNIAGKPTETTTPKYFDDITKAETEGIAKSAAAQKALYEAQMRMRMRDPNSMESKLARNFLNQYGSKYGFQAPPQMSAEQAEKYAAFITSMVTTEAKRLNDESYLKIKSQLDRDSANAKMQNDLSIEQLRMDQQRQLKEAEFRYRQAEMEATREGRREDAERARQAADLARAQQQQFASSQAEAQRQFAASQARENRSFQAGQRAQDRAIADQERKEKRTEAEAGLAINGWQLSGQIRPKPEQAQKLRDKQSSLKSLSSLADDMAKVIKANPMAHKLGSATEAGREVARIQSAILTEYNSKYAGLGALSGPDLGLLNAVTGKSLFASPGQETQLLQRFKEMLARNFGNDMSANGYTRSSATAPGGNTPPPKSPTGRRVVRP